MIFPDKQEILYSLDETAQRLKERVEQIFFLKLQALRQKSESLQHFSIHTRLGQLLGEFSNLRDQYRQVMTYKLQQAQTRLSPFLHTFQQQISFKLDQTDRQIDILAQQYSHNNPRNRAKEGWAKVSIGGSTTSLEKITPHTVFTLEDAHTKIEAICQKKRRF